MRRIRVFPALLIAAAIGTGMGHAAHISMDSVFGPGTITRDTNTGLDWLDLNLTVGPSSPLDFPLTGNLSGWRFATYSEWSDFTAPYFVLGLPVDFAAAQAFVDLMGWNRGLFDPTADYPYESCGHDDEPNCELYVGSVFIYADGTADIDVQHVNFPFEGDNAGKFYVRTTIPEPSTLWLLWGGLAVLLAGRVTNAYRRVFRG
jgi:hypothetical protein